MIIIIIMDSILYETSLCACTYVYQWLYDAIFLDDKFLDVKL